ncbi:MAG: AMP-binding protein [Clostridia bacterium]
MKNKIIAFEKVATIKEMLANSVKKFKNKTAFELRTGEFVSYQNFYKDVRELGAAFMGKYNLTGAKIAVSGKNSYEWITTYIATVCGVGVSAPIDKDSPIEEVCNLIEFADIKALVADKSVTKKLLKNFDMLPKDLLIITTDESIKDDRVLSFEQVKLYGKQLLLDGYKDFDNAQIDPEALAVILFTSGTTGMSKGVMLSNKNLCSDMYCTSKVVQFLPTDRTLSFLPLHHSFESMATLIALRGGCTIAFSGGLRYLADDFKKYKPTIFVCVPLLLEKLYEKMRKKMADEGKLKMADAAIKAAPMLPLKAKKAIFKDVHEAFGGQIRLFIVGAAALQADVARAYHSFGMFPLIGFGLTETSPIVICNTVENLTYNSLGRPLPEAEGKILDPDENGIGEICVKGPMVMLGYYNNPEATKEVLSDDGWFRTGDMGYYDAEKRNFHITGRIKNVIIAKNGKNIYPEEIEYYLNNDPLILESIIYSDSEGEESVKAKVVADVDAIKEYLKNEAPTKEEIQKAVQEVVRKINKKLPSYKSIKNFEVKTEAFVKTSTQKIKRYVELEKKDDLNKEETVEEKTDDVK